MSHLDDGQTRARSTVTPWQIRLIGMTLCGLILLALLAVPVFPVVPGSINGQVNAAVGGTERLGTAGVALGVVP